jgi:hypothetical protein
METYVHENVRANASLQSVTQGKNGKHVIHFTNGKRKVITVNTQRELTEQAHKKQCDMNFILRKYQKTGLIDHVKQHQGRYDDVSVQDFTEAMHTVSEANQMFESLPSFIRQKVGGTVEGFLDFVQNPNNKEELARLGMLKGNDGLNANGEAVASPVDDSPAEGSSGSQEPSS